MSEKEIIEKAQKIGIDINKNNNYSAMQNIAESLGMDPNNYNPNDIVNRLNEIDREEIKLQNNVDYNYNPSNYNNHNHFGQREYNEAKKDGVYDKDYYKNKDEELKGKVEKAKSDVNNKTKEEVDLDENGNAKWKEGETPSHRTWENGKETTNGAPTKNVNKTRTEQLKDKANLLKAQNERFQNKISGAKAKAYNMLHPGEALKDRAKGAVKNTAKKIGKSVKQGIKKVTGKGIKALWALIKKNPYVLLGIGIVIIIVIILALIFSNETMNGDSISKYCNTVDEYDFSIKSTPFGEDEFANKVINYYESLKEAAAIVDEDENNESDAEETEDEKNKKIAEQLNDFYENNPCYEFFTNIEILKVIYNISLENRLSPEFAIINAIDFYCIPGSNDNTTYNLWKLDCGTYYCIFSSYDDSTEYLADTMNQYDYLEDWLEESYVGEELTEKIEYYVGLRNNIFYGGNYTFDCDADYSYTGTGAYPDKGTIFRQGDPLWASIHLGHSAATMGGQGCAVTSIANGISKYAPYLNVDYFDAGVFINALNKGGCFTETGNIYWGCSAITGIAPTVHFVTSISEIGGNSNMTKINYLNQYNPNEYFLIIGYRNSYTNGHYVLFNGLIDENTYNSIDPSSLSGGIVNHNISELNQIVVYKYI